MVFGIGWSYKHYQMSAKGNMRIDNVPLIFYT